MVMNACNHMRRAWKVAQGNVDRTGSAGFRAPEARARLANSLLAVAIKYPHIVFSFASPHTLLLRRVDRDTERRSGLEIYRVRRVISTGEMHPWSSLLISILLHHPRGRPDLAWVKLSAVLSYYSAS